MFEKFINLQPKQLTLRMGLVPVEKTEENLSKYWDELRDEERALAYPLVKNVLDREYEKLIEDVLADIPKNEPIEWGSLALLIQNGSMDDTEQDKIESKIRKSISKRLKSNSKYKKLFGKEPFGKTGYLAGIEMSEDEKKACELFDKFSVYFTNFYKNRENYFTDEKKSTAIGYRIVSDNFPKFISNKIKLNNIMKFEPELYKRIASFVSAEISELCLDDLLEDNSYNYFLTQAGITRYNYAVGIINKETNLFSQQNRKNLTDGNPLKKKATSQLVTLYKQIGITAEKKFKIEKFENDEEVIDSIQTFFEDVKTNHIVSQVENLVEILKDGKWNDIYVSSNKLSTISNIIFKGYDGKRWDMLENAVKTKNRMNKDGSLYKCYPLTELQKCINDVYSDLEDEREYSVSSLFDYIQCTLNTFRESEAELEKYLVAPPCKVLLREHTPKEIKNYFDNLLEIRRQIAFYQIEDSKGIYKDENFYPILENLLDYMEEYIYLYNKVRNYVTRKPYSSDKMLLKFDNPTLSGGWSVDKETEYGTTILFHKGYYYLAISNPCMGKKEIPVQKKDSAYRKLTYNLFKNVSRMIPKCSTELKEVKAHFATGTSDSYTIDKDKFIEGGFTISKEEFDLNHVQYEGKKKWQKDYLKLSGDAEGYRDAVIKWNQFCLRFLKSYKSTTIYDYSSIKSPEEYENVNDLYGELDNLTYKMSFSNVDEVKLESMVENGEIFLFQIYNRDFSPHKKPGSKKNLHTLYWEALFSEENLMNRNIKLNGNAEVFIRRASIQEPIVHKAGEMLINKRTVSGKPIPNDIYTRLCQYYNGQEVERDIEFDKYTEDAAEDDYKIVVFSKKYDIVKDMRYTQDKYEFHVPITLNNLSSGVKNINAKVLKELANNPDVNIIGLDRGERNLVAYAVVNQKGEILEQGSFNVIGKMDYHAKLNQIEKERDEQRKSWNTISTIKDLKAGYVSQLVYSVTQLMLKHNAIIVMEDLNYGFKRGRFKIEKQIYQKFEMALIKKMNYLVTSKDEEDADKPGGIRKGYQLTTIPDSLRKVGKQCGFLFYVPAGYTSKIDPTTGFADVFNMTKLTNAISRKTFFSKFENITYDAQKDMFAFEFDYKNFDVFQNFYKTRWTVYTNSTRYRYMVSDRKTEKIDMTERLKRLFDKYGVNLKQDLFTQIKAISDKKEDAKFWSELFFCFTTALQLRSSTKYRKVEQMDAVEIDKIISPVLNRNGEFFETNDYPTEEDKKSVLPYDADTNGAYHIALKGLYILCHNKNESAVDDKDRINKNVYKITNQEWFEFRQV